MTHRLPGRRVRDARIVVSLIEGKAMRRAIDMERAGKGLGKVLEQSLHQAPPGEGPVLAWPLACGSAVADRTRAVAFTNGVLQVEVPDESWRRELMELAPRYLAAVNRYVSEDVDRIEFVVTRK